MNMKLARLSKKCSCSITMPATLVCLFFAVLCSMQDLSSPTRDLTHAPLHLECSRNHWTAREIPCLPCL